MAAQDRLAPPGAGIQEPGVQGVKTIRDRQRRHEVAPDKTDQPLHLAFVVAFARPAEPVLEQVMALQFRKHCERRRSPPFTIRATARRVLSYRIDRGTPPKKSKAATCPSQKASAVSAGYALTKQPSECGRSTQNNGTGPSCPRCSRQLRQNPPARDPDDGSEARTSRVSATSLLPHTHARSYSRRKTSVRPGDVQKSAAPYDAASCGPRGPPRVACRSTPFTGPASSKPAAHAADSPAEPNTAASS